jgi:hypothetical protein
MARPLSKPQLREIGAFVHALYRLGGYATQKEFADDAGYHQVNLSQVMGGKAGIDGLNLLHLIKAAAARAGISAHDAAARASLVEPASAEHKERITKLLREAESAIRAVRREEEQGP